MDEQSFTTINIRGAKLRYRRSGSGEPFVLAHPNISDARSFAKTEPMLAKHVDVITIYRRHYWTPGLMDLVHLLWYYPRLFLPLGLFGAGVMPVCDAAFKVGDNEAGLQAFAEAVISEKQMKEMPPERVEQMRVNIKPHRWVCTAVARSQCD